MVALGLVLGVQHCYNYIPCGLLSNMASVLGRLLFTLSGLVGHGYSFRVLGVPNLDCTLLVACFLPLFGCWWRKPIRQTYERAKPSSRTPYVGSYSMTSPYGYCSNCLSSPESPVMVRTASLAVITRTARHGKMSSTPSPTGGHPSHLPLRPSPSHPWAPSLPTYH